MWVEIGMKSIEDPVAQGCTLCEHEALARTGCRGASGTTTIGSVATVAGSLTMNGGDARHRGERGGDVRLEAGAGFAARNGEVQLACDVPATVRVGHHSVLQLGCSPRGAEGEIWYDPQRDCAFVQSRKGPWQISGPGRVLPCVALASMVQLLILFLALGCIFLVGCSTPNAPLPTPSAPLPGPSASPLPAPIVMPPTTTLPPIGVAGPTNPYAAVPAVDLPPEMRQDNYTYKDSPRAPGSCLWAACIDLLVWQGNETEAAWWRANCYGGARIPADSAAPSAVAVAHKRGLHVAWTDTGDVAFLDWCSTSRRGAAITWHVPCRLGHYHAGNHAVTFIGFVAGDALWIDNRDPEKYRHMPRDEFVVNWQRCGGAALTFLDGTPAPPRAWL
jgi:hypothetical protein